MEAVELILHELRPKWKIAEVTWGLRRLHVNFKKAVSGSDPLQGSDKNWAGRRNISVGQLVRRGLGICRVMGNTEAWKQLN